MALLEREQHLERLRAAVVAAAGGKGGIALVSGDAGIGKTSLLQALADEVGAGARVLWGGCESLFTPQPLAPLYDIGRQADGPLRAVLASDADRDAIFHATLDHLARGPAPVVVVIEDLQWADEATLDLVKFIGRRIERLGVLLVLSYREDEVGTGHPLRAVLGDLPAPLLRRIALPPLTEAAVAALACGAGRSQSALYAVTGGNPLFVTEVLAAPDGVVPPTVRDAVRARMARLSDTARTVAHLVALVPGRTEFWLLEATLGVDAGAIAECLGAGMLAREHCLAFRHEIARRAVEDDVPLPERRELHERILAALSARGADVRAARLVHHADGAGNGAEVLRLAPAAAERAAVLGAHREAAAHLALAIKYADALAPEPKAALLGRLAYEYHLTDRITEATEAMQASLALWRSVGDRLREGDTLRWLSRLSWFCADKTAADKYAAEAVVVLESLPTGRELALAYSNLSQLHMLARERDMALFWGGKAITLATELGDSEVESHALNNCGTVKLAHDDLSGRLDLTRSLALARAGGFHEHAARAYTNLVSTSMRRREFALADEFLAEGLAYCEERHLEAWTRYLVALRAVVRLDRGDWQGAAEDAEAIARRARIAPVTRVPALVTLATVRARRGDPGIEAPLDEARQLALASGELQRVAPVLMARAEVAWLAGGLPADTTELEHVFTLVCAQPDPWMKGELAFWLWRAGRLGDLPSGLATPFQRHIAGDWRGAARAWQALGCPYEQAVALADSDAESDLREALAQFERLGAEPMAGVTRRKLRALGVRGIPKGPRESTTANAHGLTTRELQVLSLLAEGHRNATIARRLYVAEKTVEHHVSAVLSKLQVGTRGEASAVAHRLGLITARNQPAAT